MRDLRTRTRREVNADLYNARRKVEQLERSAANTLKRATADLSDKLLPSAQRAVERLELELAHTPQDGPRQEDAWGRLMNHTGAFEPTPQGEIEIPDFLKRTK